MLNQLMLGIIFCTLELKFQLIKYMGVYFIFIKIKVWFIRKEHSYEYCRRYDTVRCSDFSNSILLNIPYLVGSSL